MYTVEQHVLTLRTVLYNRSHIKCVLIPGKLCTIQASVFPCDHLIQILSKPTKTAARKLSNCIFVRNLTPYESNRQRRGDAPGIVMQKSNMVLIDFSCQEPGAKITTVKTRLPGHLLGTIDVCYHILKKSKKFRIISKMNLHCPLPDVGSKFNYREVVQYGNYDAYLRELLSHHFSPKQVYSFLKSVMRTVLPGNIWGSENNSILIRKNILKLLKMRRFDSMTIGQIVNEIDVKTVTWIQGKHKTSLFLKFVQWFIVHYIFVLLRRFFYITENGEHRNRYDENFCVFISLLKGSLQWFSAPAKDLTVYFDLCDPRTISTSQENLRLFYYRKETWEQILHCVMKKHERDGVWKELKLLRIEADIHNVVVPDNFNSSAMSLFSVRVLPKTKGVRCLMKKKIIKSQNPPSFIQIPDKQLLILVTQLCKLHPYILGCSGFDIKYIYYKWRRFVGLQKRTGQVANYFVKIDIKNCFDTLPLPKLKEMLFNMFKRLCYEDIPLTPFQKRLFHSSYSTTDVWWNIEGKIQNFLLNINGKFYLKTKGIPQGWTLASILCNLLYAQLEQEEFSDLLVYPKKFFFRGQKHYNILMRVLDDFLFATTNFEEALDFLRKLHNGFPEYGLEVRPEKTAVNFPITDDRNIKNCRHIQIISQHEPIAWFGHLFHPGANFSPEQTFIGTGVGIELQRYANIRNIRNCISIRARKKTGHFQSCTTLPCDMSLVYSVSNRISVICFDKAINSYSRFMRNTYEVSLLLSFQWLAHVCSNKPVLRSVKQDSCKSVESFKYIVKNGIVNTLKKKLKKTWKLTQGEEETMMWLALKAFCKILSRHHSNFGKSLLAVKSEILKAHMKLKLNGTWKKNRIELQRVTRNFPAELRNISGLFLTTGGEATTYFSNICGGQFTLVNRTLLTIVDC